MLFLAPKWWPTLFASSTLAFREAGQKGERGSRAPWRRLRPSLRHDGFQSRRGKVSSTTTSEYSNIGRITAERRLRSRYWPSLADGWLKALDFTGQGVGPRSNGAIYSSLFEK